MAQAGKASELPDSGDPAPMDTLDVDRAWQDYQTQPTEELRNLLVAHYLPQVRYIAERMKVKLPASFELDDLIQSGVFGLLDAVNGFDPQRGVRFETYCSQRIRGAILDHLRQLDWVPRLVRSRASELNTTLRDLELELGRMPTDYEIADRLGITLDEYDDLLRESNTASIVSLSQPTSEGEENRSLRRTDMIADKKSADPLTTLERKELIDVFTRGLSRKEQLIVTLYYYEEMTMREIGHILELSESRVCQLHSRIITRLKAQLERLRTDLMS